MRPRKTDSPDTATAMELTAGAIERLSCPAGKQQAFLRDAKAPGLRVRVTAAGAKSYVYEAKLNRRTIRRTLGDVRVWSIEQARAAARELAVTLDKGQDPRELERQQLAAAAAKRQQEQVRGATVAQAWGDYLTDRADKWGERHLADHVQLARAGGEAAKRGTRGRGKTIDGPLHPLMATPLQALTSPGIERWAAEQAKTRPTSARLSWRLLRAFLSWCAEHPDYRAVVPAQNPAKSRRARESLGKAGAKRDALLKEQLPAWFAAVQALRNPLHAAYLQILLLVGCRPGELLALRWDDVNAKWKGLTIRDKVEGERTIPLTPYVHHLLAGLPRRGQFVFAGIDAKKPMAIPRAALVGVCGVAAVEVTQHGLRRSFRSLTEWLEIPAGVVAQIQGHKPSATAEKHYTVRPLDLLRVHHERIEAWMLEQAGVQFAPQAEPGKLRAVQ